MSILIKGVEMPTKHFIKGFYIDGETGNVSDISRKRIIGHAVEISTPHGQTDQKKGKWVVTSEFEDCRYVKCDQCKVTQVFYYNKPLTNFCPNCGAEMKRGE